MYKHAPHLISTLLMTGRLIVLNKKTNCAYILKDLEILIWYLSKDPIDLKQLRKLAGASEIHIQEAIVKMISFGLITAINHKSRSTKN